MEPSKEPGKIGKPRHIESPEQLWEFFLMYKQWILDNPIQKEDYVGKDGNKVYRELERPMTWERFDSLLFEKGIIQSVRDYRYNRDNRYEDYVPIIVRIDQIIRTSKFEGASAGIFNSNIIARDLGLADKTESTVIIEQPLFPE